MNTLLRNTLFLTLCFCCLHFTGLAQEPVRYEISFPNAHHHEARIRVHFNHIPEEILEVQMARSSPGRYALHEFAKNVYEVSAVDGQGEQLTVYRPDPYVWQIAGHKGEAVIEYTLFADRIDGTYASVNERQAHLNIPAAFMYSEQLKQRPVEVHFNLHDKPDWKVATQLQQIDDNTFRAPDLYYFMDSPIQLGPFDMRSWQSASNGETYDIRLVLQHEGTAGELDQYANWTKQIVEEQKAVFGELPDFEFGKYTFLVNYLPEADGDGMEHRNSTIVTSSRPLATNAKDNIGTISHEFFHAWNVERIRPASLEPFDFSATNMSGELWFAEGFTSYYTDLSLVRAGIITEKGYVQGLRGLMNYVLLYPGSRFFSPVEMSYQAPFVDAAISIDPVNRANTFISYYSYGELLGLALDLKLRTELKDKTLDGYMRQVWQAYGKAEIPYTLGDLEAQLASYTGNAAFASNFFRQHVHGKELPDMQELLGRMGIQLQQAAPESASMGMANWQEQDGQLVLGSYAFKGTPLYEAGVEKGDILLQAAGQPVQTKAQLDSLIGSRKPGDKLKLQISRFNKKREVSVLLTANPGLATSLEEKSSKKIVRQRKDWLSSKAVN
jgi:predicted metalloprotease with PDZ domain